MRQTYGRHARFKPDWMFPNEITVGGEWIFEKDAHGNWINKKTGEQALTMSLEEVIKMIEDKKCL